MTAITANGAAARRLLDKTPPDLAEAKAVYDEMVCARFRANKIFERVCPLLADNRQQPQPVDINELVRVVQQLRRWQLDAGAIVTSRLSEDEATAIMRTDGSRDEKR